MLRLEKVGVPTIGPLVLINLMVAGTYYVASHLENLLPMAVGAATPVWPAAGIALIAVLVQGLRVGPGVWLGALGTRLWLDYSAEDPVRTISASAANGLVVVLAAWLASLAMRRISRDGQFLSGVRGVSGFMIAGGLVFGLTNATLGAASRVIFGMMPAKVFSQAWQTWWIGDAVGVFLLLPLLLAWMPINREKRPARRTESIACVTLLTLAGILIFGNDQISPFRFLPKDSILALPFFVWAAFRTSLRTLTLALAIFATLAVVGTATGSGPFQRTTPGDSLLVLDAALSCLVWACLAMAALVRESELNLKALAFSEEKFSKAFRSSPLAIALTNLTEGRFLDVNNAFLAMLGLPSRSDIIGKTSMDLGMWTNPAERQLIVSRLQLERHLTDMKRPFRRASGEIGTGLFSVELIELHGEACALIIISDITEREKNEAALRQNELRLRLMAEIIAGYSFSYLVNPDGSLKLEWMSQAGEKVLGFSEGELKTTTRFRDRVHPEDRPDLQSKIDLVLAGVPEMMEFRFLTKSGQTRWLQCFNRPEWDQKLNRIVRIVGAGQDITERRTSEQALRDSLEKTPNVCVQWFDEEGKILYWNHASELTYGWSAAEAMNKTLGDLMFTSEQGAAFIGMMQEIKDTGGSFGPLEFPFTRKDGSSGICLSTLFSIPAPDGGKIYVCTDLDLTDLKKAEAERERLAFQLLRSEDEERRRIARELHDSTAQQLAVLKLNLTLAKKNSPALAPALVDCLQLTDDAIQEIRNFTWLLHPPTLDQFGLASALKTYADGFARRSQMQISVATEQFSGRLSDTEELALFRVAQEALANILRHAKSPDAQLTLDRRDDVVTLEIRDHGCGMGADSPAGVGINGMRERMRLVNGTLDIRSDSQGTTIVARVPLKA